MPPRGQNKTEEPGAAPQIPVSLNQSLWTRLPGWSPWENSSCLCASNCMYQLHSQMAGGEAWTPAASPGNCTGGPAGARRCSLSRMEKTEGNKDRVLCQTGLTFQTEKKDSQYCLCEPTLEGPRWMARKGTEIYNGSRKLCYHHKY